MSHDALEELLQQTAALRHLARDLVGEAHADDVLQESAIQAITASPAQPGPAMGWLTTVVRRLATKHRRAERVRLRHEQAAARSEVAPAERSVEDADTLRRLTGIVTALPEPYRGTILARYLRDRSPSEIAAESGEPVRTVKTRLQRGLQLLRERLAEREADWRAGLVAAFGLEPATTATAAATTAGILLMNTTTKFVLATAALLLVGAITWQLVGRDVPSADERAQVPGPVAAVNAPAPSAVGNDPPARVEVPATPAVAPAADAGSAIGRDEILVHAVDAATGAPIERFGLRAVITPSRNLLAVESPMLHEGRHEDGRLVMPAADFEQRTFHLEDSGHRYLPSQWFTLADAVERDGQRTIEAKLPLPVEVNLTIVREHGGTPVAGAKVELVRPWIHSPETTLRSNVQPAERFRAQPGETEMVMKFLGGRAMLLSGGETDAAGRVSLRVPPDEALALRLLGPGHQPVVRQPWRVPASAKPVDVVEAVTSGGTIQGRVVPLDVLRRLWLELPPARSIGETPGPLDFEVGIRFQHKGTGATIPVAKFPMSALLPIAADGTFVANGLAAGDWQVFFGFPYACQEPETEAGQGPITQLGKVEFELPAIEGLTDHELRVIDVDVSQFLTGQLDASVTRDGHDVPGRMLVRPLPGNGAPLPSLRSQPNLRPGKDGRIVANLPPARYAARWFANGGDNILLGNFVVRSAAVTRIDFVIDTVSGSWRVVESDGSTPASGNLALQLQRDGEPATWATYKVLDATGHAVFAGLPRDTVLQAQFFRDAPPVAPGTVPPQPTPIDLGNVTSAPTQGAPVVLKLPPR